MKKALIVVTSHGEMGNTGRKTGWCLPEVSHVHFPLADAGFSVDFASPKGGKAPMDQGSLDLDDPYNRRFMEDKSLVACIEATLALRDVKPEEYDVIFFAGGHGTMWDFAYEPEISRVTAAIYENGGVVAAVCHGPAALVNVKLSNGQYLVAGKEVNAFTDDEENAVEMTRIVPFLLESTLRQRGARFHKGEMWSDTVIVSDRLVTGQNPQSALSLGKKVVEVAQQIERIRK